jgi:glycosyltransferase 2 family protein
MNPPENGAIASARPSDDRGRLRSRLVVGGKVVVSGAILWYLLSGQNLSLIARHLAESDKLLWFAAFLLLAATQVLSALRWSVLLKPMDFSLPWPRVLAIYFTGMFFSLFLPSVVGGDAVKTWYVARGWRKTPAAVYTLLADRGIGLAAMMVFGLAGAILSHSFLQPALVWAISLFVITLFAGFFLFPYLSNPVLALFAKLREMPRERLFTYWVDRRPAARAFLISLPVHMAMVVVHVVMARSLGIEVGWQALMFVYPVVALASMIPVGLNGMGWRDAAYIWALGFFGVSSGDALSLAGMWFTIVLLSGLLGVVPFLLLRKEGKGLGEADGVA